MRKFVADFETIVNQFHTRIWAFGLCEIGNKSNFSYGNSMEDFIDWCKEENRLVYFHNLKFDGTFIIDWLLKNGFVYSEDKVNNSFNTTISGLGQFYSIEIIFKKKNKKYQKVTFYDSAKKLPMTVKRIAEAFKLDIRKGELDYKTYREVGHIITPAELAYIKNDVQIVAEALDIQFKQGLTKMTVGGDALQDFKDRLGERVFERNFPVVPLPMNEEFRKAYRGGFTYLSPRYTDKDIGTGMVYDVTSLYPDVMYNQPLPYGQPIYYYGRYQEDNLYPLYIQSLYCEFTLKPDKIPTIQIKNNGAFVSTDYLENSGDMPVTLNLTNVDLDLFFDHYDVIVHEWIAGFKFKQCHGVFNEYIDYWSEIKKNSKGGLRELAKLMLNSLYGKFATNPDITGRYPVLENEVVRYKKQPPKFRKPIYTPIGVFITAWARYKTITTAQSVYPRFIYADTDSIHLEGDEVPDIEVGNNLGQWKFEGKFKKARFLRAKSYIEYMPTRIQIKDTRYFLMHPAKIHVTCAGMSDEVKAKVNWHNFKIGFSETGSLKAMNVPGGIYLKDTNFTISGK